MWNVVDQGHPQLHDGAVIMREDSILHAESLDEYTSILNAALDLASAGEEIKLLDGFSVQVPAELAARVRQYQQVSESSAPKKSTKKKESAE